MNESGGCIQRPRSNLINISYTCIDSVFMYNHPILLMVQAVRRIQATPGFTGKAAEAAAAYHKQRQQAATAVELVRRRYAVPAGQALSWMKRPNVQKVAPTHPMCTGPDL